MKKTLYSIFAVLSLCLAFVSCDDDDIDVNRGTHSQLPETVVAGTYNGQYVVYKADGVTEVGTYPATVTMTAGESKYTVRLESVCDQADINGAEEMPLNISWANDDIKFWGLTTPGTTAGFLNSAGLNGTYSNGTLSFKFSKTIREGRSTVTKFYVFNGTN